ncbi:uncharacterized protein LOC132593050 isoform X7 [Zootoca vivipara]|uniref:uncharacterized protein LOC132593050 isoform X7 n=1 Tax=Zootoca vivipara TaxID=8524 RepID=UPI00293BE479|nr:uncharacterized protein LOC132593050 isoform X7 [Zootoca vivipara]
MEFLHSSASEQIIFLQGENYQKWAKCTQKRLQDAGVWYTIAAKRGRDNSPDQFPSWKSDDSFARGMIILSLCPGPLIYVGACNSACEMWESLKLALGGGGSCDGDSPNDCWSAGAPGCKPQEELAVMSDLVGVQSPVNARAEGATWELQQELAVMSDLEQVAAQSASMEMAEGASCKSQGEMASSSHTAVQSRGNQGQSSKSFQKPRRKHKPAGAALSRRRGKEMPTKVKLVDKAQPKGGELQPTTVSQGKEKGGGQEQKPTQQQNGTLLARKVQRKFVVSSTVQKHICSDRSLFACFSSQDGFVKSSEGLLSVQGTGHVYLGGLNLTLCDVLYVQDAQNNLLSISQMSEEGYGISFENGSCLIKKGDEEFLNAPRVDNQYVFTFDYVD